MPIARTRSPTRYSRRTPPRPPTPSPLLPTRAALFERLAEWTPAADGAPAALVLIGLLRRDTVWPMPGSELDRVAGVLSANVRGDDWLARSGATECAVLLGAASHDAETAADRAAPGRRERRCPRPHRVRRHRRPLPRRLTQRGHRRATLCLTTARSVGGSRVIRYRGTLR